MTGPNFMDEIDCGSFFDHIDDLLDFPGGEDIDAGVMPLGKSSDSLPSIWSSAQSESLHGSDSVFSSTNGSDLSTELSVPYEEIVQLEWLSTFVEDSFSGGSLTMSKEDATNANNGSSIDDNNKNSDNKVLSSSSPRQFQTSSPVSVLESSSSCSGDKPVPLSPEEAINPAARCGRARSKRPRPAAFDPRPAMQVISSPESSVPENEAYPENHAESYPLIIKVPNMPQTNIEVKKKKKKIKFTMHSSSAMAEVDPNAPPQQPVRKCLHCEITKTPQWRAGPMGPKTLCNACGVRYKSGRLFPEYRPAASPTFVPALHSNSHKKVLEMRSRTVEHAAAIEGIAPIESDPAPELIPNMSHRLDYM